MLSDALTILCGHRFQPMSRRSRAEIDTPPVRAASRDRTLQNVAIDDATAALNALIWPRNR